MPPKVKLSRRAASGEALARVAALAAFDKKAAEIVILDLSAIESAPSDYFVICSCGSTVQVQAVASAVETACREAATQLPRTEGWDALEWVIVDCFDVVVHIMTAEARDFYKLEKLWGDGNFSRLNDKGEILADKPATAKAARPKKAAKGETV